LEQLSALKSLQGQLKELSLNGNPVQSGDKDAYRSYVQTVFPKLEVLDRQPFSQISFPVAKVVVNLPHPNPSFADSPTTQTLVTQFLQKFFDVYDNKRQDVSNAYDNDAMFSLTLGKNQIYAEVPSKQSKDELNNYYERSRNLKQISEPKRRQELLGSNRFSIMHYLMQLPKTRHDLSKAVVDTHMLEIPLTSMVKKQLIMVTVHAAFHTDEYARSFDRIFVLDGPIQDQQTHGWPARIINDQLHIRPFGTLDLQLFLLSPEQLAQKQEEERKQRQQQKYQQRQPQQQVQPNLPTGETPLSSEFTAAAAAVSQPQLNASENKKEQMISQLSNETNLKYEYAKKCLIDNDWDYQKAKNMFAMLRNKIPPDGFK
jgi:nuclear RNA export factor